MIHRRRQVSEHGPPTARRDARELHQQRAYLHVAQPIFPTGTQRVDRLAGGQSRRPPRPRTHATISRSKRVRLGLKLQQRSFPRPPPNFLQRPPNFRRGGALCG